MKSSDDCIHRNFLFTEDKIGGVFMYFCVFARATVGFQVFWLTDPFG